VEIKGEKREEKKKQKSKYRMKQVILWNAAKRLSFAFLFSPNSVAFVISLMRSRVVMSKATQSECS
jgi:hypothetical protein